MASRSLSDLSRSATTAGGGTNSRPCFEPTAHHWLRYLLAAVVI
ncbi:MAG: hypothetical protein V7K38_04865 [Nostoc sp.]